MNKPKAKKNDRVTFMVKSRYGQLVTRSGLVVRTSRATGEPRLLVDCASSVHTLSYDDVLTVNGSPV